MKPALLDYLRCPNCESELILKPYEQQRVELRPEEKDILLKNRRDISVYETEIIFGSLICNNCETTFPIWKSVPRIYRKAEKDFPIDKYVQISTVKLANHKEDIVQTSFGREWDEFNYEDGVIWLWTIDERIDTFCEELGISSPEEIKGKLMIDAGCGSGILSMNLSEKYSIEIIAFDITNAVERASRVNKSNICHFIQASVFSPPLAEGISDITHSHGVLHHTYDTKKAFNSIEKLTKKGGMLYVWLYGKKRGYNWFRYLFFRSARTIISRLPKAPQTFMVYVMAFLHLGILSLKKILGMKRTEYKTFSQFLVGIRDKYTPVYAREHTEEEVKNWFKEAGYKNVCRRTQWGKTPAWRGSTDLSVKGIRE